MSVYDQKPQRFLKRLHKEDANPRLRVYCAGFEDKAWRSSQFAFHLAEWLPEYALPEEELRVDHGNVLVKLNQAAIRVYTSEKYASRGEAGEIALHAVCRDFFNTIPISPRVFYKSASNDVIKAFDLVHVRFPKDGPLQVWLGESKLYKSGTSAVSDAVKSINDHLDAGFLTTQKILLGPQIPKTTPHYDQIMQLFSKQESLDTLLASAVFVVGIMCDSKAAAQATCHDSDYSQLVADEINELNTKLGASGLPGKIKIVLVYIPLASKKSLVDAFDKRLKGLQ